MSNLFQLWNKVCGTVNTHQAGWIKPQRQFVDWVHDTSKELLREKVAAFQKTQIITDDLTPFLHSVPVKVVPGGPVHDVVPFPKKYGHVIAMRFYHKEFKEIPEITCKSEDPFKDQDYSYELPPEVTEQTIDIIDTARWGAIFTHKTKKPTIKKPYATQFDKGFKIAPKGISFVVVDFFSEPEKATFDYTLGSNDEIIFNENTSIPLPWPDLVDNEFVLRAEKKFGKFTRDPFLYQAADKDVSTGT